MGKGKLYKTWEALKILTENPNQKFRRYLEDGSNYLEIYRGNSGALFHVNAFGSDQEDAKFLEREWELVEEPVSFMEAVEAGMEGKLIRSEEFNGFYPLKDIFQRLANGFDRLDLIKGKWYIERGNE
jgi:hypothetical protein